MPCWKEAAGLSSGDILATLAEAMIKQTPRGGLPPEYATVRRVWGRTPPLFGENPACGRLMP